MLVRNFPNLSETFILNQITGLIDAGHEVDVFARGSKDGVKVHADVDRYQLLDRTRYPRIPTNKLWRVAKAMVMAFRSEGGSRRRRSRVLAGAVNVAQHGSSALSLELFYTSINFLEARRYDIIHVQVGTLGAKALALLQIGATDGDLVVSFRGSDLTVEENTVGYRALFETGKLFLPVCESFADKLVDMGCDPQRIRVHYSGIELSRFPFSVRRRSPDEPTRILTVARLVEKKGLAYAIDAIEQIKATGKFVRYTIIGEGALRPQLEKMVHERHLSEEITLVGPKNQAEVIEYLRDAHLFIAPSVTAKSGDQEGIPNVLKEAMAMGLPVVSTLHSGIPELVEEGVSGFLVPERDHEALADRLSFLIDHPERWAEMGRAGRARVEADFDSAKLNDRLIGLYEQVISRRMAVPI